jgi:transcriptional regulator of acetoin/glycerol metabolism
LPPDIAALLVPDGSGRAIQGADGCDERDERTRIIEALTRHQWRPNAAAAALGISRATLYRRIARLKISGPHRV